MQSNLVGLFWVGLCRIEMFLDRFESFMTKLGFVPSLHK